MQSFPEEESHCTNHGNLYACGKYYVHYFEHENERFFRCYCNHIQCVFYTHTYLSQPTATSHLEHIYWIFRRIE